MENAEKDCCAQKTDARQGIIYGLIPHIGCIAFIAGSILGVTVLTEAFKPMLLNRYFFYILVAISLGFATLSSMLYLRKNGMLNRSGIGKKWKYLSAMYGSTIGVNLALFLFVFPALANMNAGTATAGASTITLAVDIPCSGHATLISGELKTIDGVEAVTFSAPNKFTVSYDPAKTDSNKILALDVFKTYSASLI
jgi:hypothetical protein